MLGIFNQRIFFKFVDIFIIPLDLQTILVSIIFINRVYLYLSKFRKKNHNKNKCNLKLIVLVNRK